mgnify:CR=1 FL=1
MNSEFKGIYVAAVTPFREDGSFDIEKSKRHLDWLIENGVQGVCVLGATGEYQSVSNEEHMAYVREIVPYIKDRVSVIVGATRESPDASIALIENVKMCGGHAAMVLTPPYCHPSQSEILENYRYLMEKTSFPIVIYNNPGSCGVSIEKETFAELMRLPYAAIVKESSGTMQKLTEVLMDAPENVSVFCGCDNLAFESFAGGACGWISMLANVAPRQCVELYKTVYEQHDLKAGWEIYRTILPALNVLETFPKPVQALKYLVDRKTGNGGFSRRPRMALTAGEQAYVIEAMHADELY